MPHLASISRIVWLFVALVLAGLLFNTPFELHRVCPYVVVGSLSLLPLTKKIIYTPGFILGVFFFLTSLVFPRFFCGFICPLGTIQDCLIFPAQLLRVECKPKPRVNEFLSRTALLLLLATILGGLFYRTLFCIRACPMIWGLSLCRIPIPPISAILLSAFFLSAIATSRGFCRYFCPYGYLISIPSRFALFKLFKQIEACNNCRLCNKICPMGVDIDGSPEYIESIMCISCYKCLKVCPKNALKIRRKK
jgi:polyferredoxin